MKMMNFNSVRDKVAIVTGASRGIGRAIAECFGENGMKVVCAARSAEQGQAVADGICAKGGDAIFIQTDCSKASAIKELVDKTVAHYGKLDGVVSNAGIGMGGTPLHEYEVEDYEKIFSLNSEGVFAGMKYGAEAILKSHSEGGFLINVASVAGSCTPARTGTVQRHQVRRGGHDPCSGTGLRRIRYHRQRHLPRLHQDQHLR